jgi:hypothetical protein
MDYINFEGTIGYIYLTDGKIPNLKHTVFCNHIKYEAPVVGCQVEKDDYIVRAISNHKNWIFETYQVLDVENDVAFLNKVTKQQCNIGIDIPVYAEDALYREMQSYFDDLSVYECNLEYSEPGYADDDSLEIEVEVRTVVFESGYPVQIIKEKCQERYKRTLKYPTKYYCSLKEGMIIASEINEQVQYKIVQTVSHMSKLVVTRDVHRSVIGEEIANVIDIAMQEQNQYIEDTTELYLALAFDV